MQCGRVVGGLAKDDAALEIAHGIVGQAERVLTGELPINIFDPARPLLRRQRVRITANRIVLSQDAVINSTTEGDGKAGVISLVATEDVTIKGRSRVTTTTSGKRAREDGSDGQGGQIIISAFNVDMADDKDDEASFRKHPHLILGHDDAADESVDLPCS